MAFDPRIILGAGVGVQPIDTPLQMEAKRAALGQVRQQAADEAQARAAQQAFQQALQATGGDYDAAIRQSEQQGYNMLPMRETIQKQRNTILDGVKKGLDNEKLSSGLMGQIIPNIHSQDDWNAWLPKVAQIDPEFVQHVGPRFDEKQFASFANIGVDADKQFEASQKAIEALSKGDYLKAAAAMRFTSHSPEDWDGAKSLLSQYKIPTQIISHVEQMTPEEVQQAVQGVPKPEKDTTAKVGTFEDYVIRTYGENPTPAQILQARKAYGQADDRARVSVSVAGGGAGVGELTPEGIDYAATQYRLTGKMPALGMGKTPARAQIINKAAEQVRMVGQTPVAAIQRQAAFSADSKALAKLTGMSSAAEAYENKALGQLDIVDGLSDKVSRTSIPLINRAIIAGKTEIAGDPDATLLLNAIMTASTEYAKIMMGGTGSAQAVTDSAQKEAAKLLNASMNKTTLRRATALMRTEMGLTMQGYDAALGHINERMGGQPQTPAGTASPTAPKVQKWGRDASGKLVPQ